MAEVIARLTDRGCSPGEFEAFEFKGAVGWAYVVVEHVRLPRPL